MTTARAQERMTSRQLQSYWQNLSRKHLAGSADGFEVICFAGMPSWFNRFMHRYQVKAFARLLSGETFADSDVLDVGTGVGRWARWYAAWPGARVVGIDIERDRLERAKRIGGGPRYECMSADDLQFDACSFDAVNSVTVLQHVPHEAKTKAIAEFARVLRPGGRAVLFEITDLSDDAPHVFPWAEREWRDAFAAHGMRVRRRVGDQYTPLLRGLKRLHSTAFAASSRREIDAMKDGRYTAPDRAKMAVLRAVVAASYPIEEVCRFLPPSSARITGFLFEKSRTTGGAR